MGGNASAQEGRGSRRTAQPNPQENPGANVGRRGWVFTMGGVVRIPPHHPTPTLRSLI